MKPSKGAGLLVWAGLLGMIAVISGWLLVHPPEMFGWWLGLFLIAPLLFPIRGLLQGRPYTYAAMSLVALLYLVIGVTEGVANPEQRAWAYAMLVCSVTLFVGCVLFVRLEAAERRRGD